MGGRGREGTGRRWIGRGRGQRGGGGGGGEETGRRKEGGGVRWGKGFDLGLGVRGVSLFLFCFFFLKMDGWMDVGWRDGCMDGWTPCHRSVGRALIGSENR